MSDKDTKMPIEADINNQDSIEEGTFDDSSLPQDTVFCFPANNKQVIIRRILTGFFGILSVLGIIFFLIPDNQNYILSALLLIIFVVCLLVFIQTFLISNFRVALDYNQKKVILRYMFRKLSIDFDNFDAKEGVPDKAEQMIRQHAAGTERQNRMYLILDDVYADACYQTTSSDLASIADFLKLKEESFKIAQVYKAKERYNELKNALDPETQTEYQSLVDEAMKESTSNESGISDIEDKDID